MSDVLPVVPPRVPSTDTADVDADTSLTITVRACTDAAAAVAQLRNGVRLQALHMIVEEECVDLDTELQQLYRRLGECDLQLQKLDALSVSWHARNADDMRNPVRLMALVALLQQLDWTVCTSVLLHLHINYLQDDPRLDLIRTLPVTLHVYGEQVCADEMLEDHSALLMLAKSYPYIAGAM